MSSEAQLTPMMAQYRRIKSELPKDALLLFRLGDFYEMFFDDALTGAHLLNVALTKRGAVPMCGIPFHAANAYIGRLLRAGRKVAICDQMEDARPGQLVKREVTQILSPGTHFDERLLTAERNNFLGAVYPVGRTFGLAFADLTTGDFLTTEVEGETALLTELQRVRPAEVLYPGDQTGVKELLRGEGRGGGEEKRPPLIEWGNRQPSSRNTTASFGWILSAYDDWVFGPETALFTVRDHLKVASLDGFGLKDRMAATGAAGAVLHYLTQHLRRDVANLTRISFYQRSDYLALDFTTLRHLEILEPLHQDSPRNACLFGAMHRTVTPMGARRLRDWLSQPLATVEPIRRRQEAVKTLLENSAALDGLRAQLAQVRDLERTIGRLSAGSGNARDLIALQMALEQIPNLKLTLHQLVAAEATRLTLKEDHQTLLGAPASLPARSAFPQTAGRDAGAPGFSSSVAHAAGAPSEMRDTAECSPTLLDDFERQVTEPPDLVELLARAIVDEPPLALKEGGLIRDGFDTALDELRAATRGG